MSAILVERQRKLLAAQARQAGKFADRLERERLKTKAEAAEKRRLERVVRSQDREIRRLSTVATRQLLKWAAERNGLNQQIRELREELARIRRTIAQAQEAQDRLRRAVA